MVGRRPIVPLPGPSLPGRALAFMESLMHKALDGDLPSPAAKVVAARPDQNSILKHPTERSFSLRLPPSR